MKEVDFIKELKEKRDLKNIKTAKEKVEVFWESIIDVLKKDGKLELKGWGKFEVKETNERIFNNPRTKKIEKISPINKIVFKQGKALKQKFNEEI